MIFTKKKQENETKLQKKKKQQIKEKNHNLIKFCFVYENIITKVFFI